VAKLKEKEDGDSGSSAAIAIHRAVDRHNALMTSTDMKEMDGR